MFTPNDKEQKGFDCWMRYGDLSSRAIECQVSSQKKSSSNGIVSDQMYKSFRFLIRIVKMMNFLALWKDQVGTIM